MSTAQSRHKRAVDALQSRHKRAIEALKTIADGDARAVRKADICSHGQYGYEDCENCICEYAKEVLDEIGENKDAKI